jgi:hypothetical protein
MKSAKRRFGGLLGVVVLLAALLLATRASASVPPTEPGCGTLRQCIANEAQYQYGGGSGHKYEKPLGSNCNFFTKKNWHAPGATKCANGWWSEEWCMDFSRWVYKAEGASVAHLSHLAFSAKNYSTYKTYNSGRRPKVGDLAVWASESHVGIVVAVGSGTATVISGNSYNPGHTGANEYTAIYKKTYASSTFQGFAGPVRP